MYFNAVTSRVDVALYAFLAVITMQLLGAMACKIFGKVYPPVPIIEWFFRPVIVFLCDRLNRAGRSDFALLVRGIMVFFITLIAVTILIKGSVYSVNIIGYGQYGDLVALILCLSPIAALWPMIAVSYPMTKDGNYRAMARMLNINLVTSDDHGLRRMAGKGSVLALSSMTIGPILFFILFGLPGLILYMACQLFTRVAATNSNKFRGLAGMFYAVLQWPVSFLTTLFIILGACFSAGGRPLKALAGFKDGPLREESALAYSQNLILGGSYQTRTGESVKARWLGAKHETAKLSERDVVRMVIQHAITLFLMTTVLLAAYLFL